MAIFVLVHGAWHGGWCWRDSAAILRQRGHEVYTPTLTGLGERAHLANADVDLETHIRDVLGVLDSEELSDVVLCGHSYGGMVITPVLDRKPEAFKAAMWLDAFVPRDGQSLMDSWPAERAQHIREEVATRGEGWKVPPMPASYFGIAEENVEWVERRCVPQPIRTFTHHVHLTGAWKTVPKKMYVLAEGHPNSSFGRFAEPLSEDPDWDVRRVSASHDVMVDAPEELAALLEELA